MNGRSDALYMDIGVDEGSRWRFDASDPISITAGLALFQEQRKRLQQEIARRAGLSKWRDSSPEDVEFALDLIERLHARAHLIIVQKTPSGIDVFRHRFNELMSKLREAELIKGTDPFFLQPPTIDDNFFQFTGLASGLTVLSTALFPELEQRPTLSIRSSRIVVHIGCYIDKASTRAETQSGFEIGLRRLLNSEIRFKHPLVPRVRFKLKGLHFLTEQEAPILLLVDHFCGIVASKEFPRYRLPDRLRDAPISEWHTRLIGNRRLRISRETLDKMSENLKIT